jgi:hypothetical protein
MPRISSLITKGFRTPDVVPGYWSIPQGALIMYNSATDPGLTGWTRYSAADGKFIKGTATQGEIGTVTANNNTSWQSSGYSSLTGTGGSHSGPGANYQDFPPGSTFPQTNVDTYPNTAGSHQHTVTFFPGAGSDLNPASTDYILLEATQEQKKLPVNTVVAKSTQPVSSTQELSSTTYRYIRGGVSYTNTAATSRTLNGSSDTFGPHNHGVSNYTGLVSGGTTNTALSQIKNSLTANSHSHSVTATITGQRLSGKLLKLWKLASEVIPDDNIIIMYTGNISSLPSYWKVCNGTNGTPNMVNYFLGYSTIATAHDTTTSYVASVSVGSLSTESWSHSHITASVVSRIGYGVNNLHTTTNASHSHTISTNPSGSNVFQPDEIKLCFIQLTKTIY